MKRHYSCRSRLTWIVAMALLLVIPVISVKRSDFRTCSQSAFCRRQRAYGDAADKGEFRSPYELIPESILIQESGIFADVKNIETNVLLTLDLKVLEDNTARIRINEKNPIKPRYEEHAKLTLHAEPLLHAANSEKDSNGVVTLTMDADGERKIAISPNPLRIDFIVSDSVVVSLNDRGFFNFEHLRKKETHMPKMVTRTKEDGSTEEVEDDSEEGLWEETFKTWTDPKPNGPESLGLDISFHGFSHVYGIPEHATNLSLKETKGGDGAYVEPYRLFNSDVFEYALDSPMSLYGSIPVMMAHQKDISVGVFWMNPSETWVDVVKSNNEEKKTALQKAFSIVTKNGESKTTQTHWFSEAGVLDLFVFLGPTAKDVIRQYTKLTGPPALPQIFSLGYHQSRWNYINQKDVLEVDSQFDNHDMPYDVIWLDIEYTEEKKYFTWDTSKFPDAIAMEKQLAEKGRQLVVIIDPHLKREEDYRIFEEAKNKGYFVKQTTGEDFEGWCWPGQSSWVDTHNPAALEWWGKQFSFDKFNGSRENVYIWNDMNEPAIFNGPEITMPREMIHHGNWEHRVLHNIYGMLLHGSTSKGLKHRTSTPKRPFVLSRSFYAGAQRHGAVWTGDNMANWDSLYYTNPMILTNGLAGLPFTGADIPGFFYDPSFELLTRWYQAGVFQPFFRGHAHIDTKRREPYLIEEPFRSITRASLQERYALLPYWYTLFYDAFKHGTPMMRPMFMEFPQDETLFATEDQFMVGSGIMVRPVTTEGAVAANVYFAGDEPWYDMQSHKQITDLGHQVVDAPLEKIPAYYRGGNIIPRRERVRRSTAGMKFDPITLVVALDNKGQAQGTLYLDDGETFDYERGAFAHTLFKYENNVLSCTSLHTEGKSRAAKSFAAEWEDIHIERIQVLGAPIVKRVLVSGKELLFENNHARSELTIKNPKTSAIACDWNIDVQI